VDAVPGHSARLALANDHAGLTVLSEWLARFADGLPEQTVFRLNLVLTEAVTNIMDHAKQKDTEGRIELACSIENGLIRVELVDDGPPFDPTAQTPRLAPASLAEARPGGHGIQLMRRYTTRMDYRREDGRNILNMTLPVDPAPAPDGVADSGRALDYRRIQIFQGLSDPRIDEVLASSRHIRLNDGDRLIKAGQDNHYLYLLVNGHMEARLSSERSEKGIAIAPGEAIGELSILDGQKTSAHVYSVGECDVVAVHEDDFWQRLAPLPGVLRNLTRLVTQRLRASSERMLRTLAEQLKYEHMKKELAAARDIQMGLLPHGNPLFPEHPQVEVHAHLLPAKEVGGDLYDAFPVDDEHLLLAVGDVSGKGMPAALFMMRTVTLLRSLGRGKLPDEQFLPTLNRLLCEGNEADMFVTLCLVVFSVRSGRLILFNGGHPPPLLSRAGGPFEAVTGAKGALLGIMPEVRFQCRELTVSPGDRLVLYSDGVTEAENPDRDMLGLERTRTLLDDCPADAPMADLVTHMTEGVSQFAAGAEQSDDITILALRYRNA